MEAVRLTFHKGYRHKDGTPYSPKHDDRNGFEKEKSAENNVYENYAALTWGGETFYDSEIAGYKSCFGAHIKRYNAQRKKERHPEECMDIKQYYKKHPPEETLMYLGNKDNNVGSEVLLEVFHIYREWLNSTCVDNDKGCGVELLNSALHMDEATPHIQFRQMYYYTDKYGNFEISQNKALEGLGYGKGINAKKDFTAASREKLIEIARSRGVELITEPLPKEEVGRTREEYIAHEKLKAERAEMEQDFQEREKDLERRERDLTIDEKDREDYYAFVEAKREREVAEAAERRREQMLCEKEESQVRYADVLENARENVQETPETTKGKETIPDTPKAQTSLKTPYRGYDVQRLLQQWDNDHNDDPEMSL